MPVNGHASFFLLTDTSYGTRENALVRVEIPSHDGYQEYDGVDIRVYRVEKPLDFLRKQSNFHRLSLKGNYRGDQSISHMLSYLWDSWFKDTRRAWQRILSFDARKEATENRPELQTGNNINRPTVYEHQTQFAPLSGHPMVLNMRYPIWDAKPVMPPEGTKLDGSSSGFISPTIGNAMVSLGKLPAGLYIVEGIIGTHQATTLLFVSDTVAITKVSGAQMLVWTADRSSGKPVSNVALNWTDGVGTLKSKRSDAEGLAILKHKSPEKTYVIGEDESGGVFISENFYYDSEIYNTKLYTFTDRPLYRPGDRVNIKWLGRTFTSAQHSTAPKTAPLSYQVIDPGGTILFQQKTDFTTENAATSEFTLPPESIPGGYEIRTAYNGDVYSSSFRVANYVKPHFEIHLNMDKAAYKVGEPLQGEIELRYANGEPVKEANVSVTVRSQQTSMVSGELFYAGMFPVKLEQQELVTSSSGKASLKFPAAKEPSRYIVTVLANDGAAYRVKSTQEILVERGVNTYSLHTTRQFTMPDEEVTFSFSPQGTGGSPPVSYEMIRLEDQTKTEGKLDSSSGFSPRFSQSGSYQINLKDEYGNILGAINHWVMGKGIQTLAGNIEIIPDKKSYAVGETAEVLITFPHSVEGALFTLERDQVEATSTLTQPSDWLQLEKITDSQYKARIRIEKKFTPNMTFSVLSMREGGYVFENAGLVVKQPEISLEVKADKTAYKPREQVHVDINALFDNQPVQAKLSVSIVDEMVYVLQPEIAPSIVDFFYHPRRNNVRTTSSLNFIGYDMSTSYLSKGSKAGAQRFNERGVKVLERPRRDDKDTAAWEPNLTTDAKGRARLSFTMPDSLTRWRVTVRAITPDGKVGQRVAYIQSEQPYYLKWVANKLYRDGDKSLVDVVAFNYKEESKAQFTVKSGTEIIKEDSVNLKRGINYLTFNLNAKQSELLNIALKVDGKEVDSLDVAVDTRHARWQTAAQEIIPIDQEKLRLALPKDARAIELSFLDQASGNIYRVMDDLINYPYGCVEQTASRLIPLSMAYQASTTKEQAAHLREFMLYNRMRLVAMVLPDAQFSWWGTGSSPSTMMTAYAYYADWFASRQLGLDYDRETAQQLLGIYQKQAHQEPVLYRALSLWWMNQMGLPVDTLLVGVDKELATVKLGEYAPQNPHESMIFAYTNQSAGHALALGISAQLHRERGSRVPEDLKPAIAKAYEILAQYTNQPVAQSLLILSGKKTSDEISANSILRQISPHYPTLERALTLSWLHKAQSLSMNANRIVPALVSPWETMNPTVTGQPRWKWSANSIPDTLDFSGQRRPAFALVRYQTNEAQKHTLDVGVKRTLYELVPEKGTLNFKVKAVPQGTALQSNVLYVDEITLSSQQAFQYGLLEIPLPAGAEVEGRTWGVKIKGLGGEQSDKAASFAHGEYETGTLSYRVPVADMAPNREIQVRHLVRFNQRGEFKVPSARMFLMYQPDRKAIENGKDSIHQLTVK